MKNKGFMMIELLLCLSILSVCVNLCYFTANAVVHSKEIIDERLNGIQDNEMMIIDMIENGCGLGCITTVDIY